MNANHTLFAPESNRDLPHVIKAWLRDASDKGFICPECRAWKRLGLEQCKIVFFERVVPAAVQNIWWASGLLVQLPVWDVIKKYLPDVVAMNIAVPKGRMTDKLRMANQLDESLFRAHEDHVLLCRDSSVNNVRVYGYAGNEELKQIVCQTCMSTGYSIGRKNGYVLAKEWNNKECVMTGNATLLVTPEIFGVLKEQATLPLGKDVVRIEQDEQSATIRSTAIHKNLGEG